MQMGISRPQQQFRFRQPQVDPMAAWGHSVGSQVSSGQQGAPGMQGYSQQAGSPVAQGVPYAPQSLPMVNGQPGMSSAGSSAQSGTAGTSIGHDMTGVVDAQPNANALAAVSSAMGRAPAPGPAPSDAGSFAAAAMQGKSGLTGGGGQMPSATSQSGQGYSAQDPRLQNNLQNKTAILQQSNR